MPGALSAWGSLDPSPKPKRQLGERRECGWRRGEHEHSRVGSSSTPRYRVFSRRLPSALGRHSLGNAQVHAEGMSQDPCSASPLGQRCSIIGLTEKLELVTRRRGGLNAPTSGDCGGGRPVRSERYVQSSGFASFHSNVAFTPRGSCSRGARRVARGQLPSGRRSFGRCRVASSGTRSRRGCSRYPP